MEGKRVYSVSVPVSGKISFAVMIPPFELKTEKARGVLRRSIPAKTRCLTFRAPL